MFIIVNGNFRGVLMFSHYINRQYKSNLKGQIGEYALRVWTDSNGEEHREDGPAKIWIKYNGNEWYIHGREMTKEQWLQWLKDGNSSLSTNEVTRLILEWS
jgi:hypothetical protein